MRAVVCLASILPQVMKEGESKERKAALILMKNSQFDRTLRYTGQVHSGGTAVKIRSNQPWPTARGYLALQKLYLAENFDLIFFYQIVAPHWIFFERNLFNTDTCFQKCKAGIIKNVQVRVHLPKVCQFVCWVEIPDY